jgi:hypothetical protein
MAVAYKRLGAIQSSGVIGTADTLYNMTATSAVISTIVACNTSATPANITIGISTSVSGAVYTTAGYLVYQMTVPGNDSVNITAGYTLDSTNKFLLCSASATTVSFSAFGSEIS